MSKETSKYLKFGGATALILMSLAYLAYTGVQESKSYYLTIKELRGMAKGIRWEDSDRDHTERF